MTEIVTFTSRAEKVLFPNVPYGIPADSVPIIMWALSMEQKNPAGEIIAKKGPHYMMGWDRREKLDPRCILVELKRGTVAVRPRPETLGLPALKFDFDDIKREFVEVA
ncbi:MAG: hypothetical protein INF18_09595 [Methylobacterium sp.]|nr:hypothetical protein [Methylobacterium sp.]MCA3638074.1 hypothetical protein [Methylobacterium sp.]